MSGASTLACEAIVLAGGLGTRLSSVSGGRPKALVEVGGRAFVDWQLDYLAAQGVRRVVLATGHRGDAIVAHVGTHRGPLSIDCVREAAPLGTGGATRRALQEIAGRGAFVLNGDTFAAADLRELEGRDREHAVMTVAWVDDAAAFGSIGLEDGHVATFAEKSAVVAGWVNAGVYWLRRDVFDAAALPEAFSLERDFLAPNVAALRPRAVRLAAPFVDIGTPEALAAAQTAVPAMVARATLSGGCA